MPAARRQTVVKRRTLADLGSTSWKCVTSDPMGRCSFGPRPQITGASSNPMVDQNVWNPITGWHQTLYANGPGDWKAVANMPAGNTAVLSYPNAWAYYSGRVNRYRRITSSFSENMNKTSGTRAWAAYDLWFNNWHNEVMIQHDFAPNSARCGSYVASATFGGSHGVPSQTWKLCLYGSEIIWQLPTNERSGSVAILGMIKWLERHGYLPSGSTWTAISHGFEICSTGGHREKFRVSRFSVIARRK